MMIPVHFTLFFLWVTKDFGSALNRRFQVLKVELGKPLTLNCTYNCSTGFVRGCWKKKEENECLGTFDKTFCTVSLQLSNVSIKDLKRTFTCYTVNTEDPQFYQTPELYIRLNAQDQRSDQNWTTASKTETSLPAKPNDSSEGEFTGIKVLATVTVAVATVLAALAAYLCLKRNRQSRNSKGDPAMSRSGSPQPSHSLLQPMKGTQAAQSERVTLRIPPPDNGSDTEVPYADIMITVRGVSTPELTQVSYLSAGEQKEWWGEESRSHLQASRSADRLHVPHPREVSRKMSTNSEYAVITYA